MVTTLQNLDTTDPCIDTGTSTGSQAQGLQPLGFERVPFPTQDSTSVSSVVYHGEARDETFPAPGARKLAWARAASYNGLAVREEYVFPRSCPNSGSGTSGRSVPKLDLGDQGNTHVRTARRSHDRRTLTREAWSR